MIPCNLKITGFLSYQDTVELDFTGFDLACITGSNGAGKSSLLDAITWVLFGQARRRDDAVINSHASSAKVAFDFLYENNLYRVQRSKARDKTTQLELLIHSEDQQWHSLTEHSLRETELKIQNILQLDYDTFINASFFLQGKADQFAQQRPGDRKRILVNILGLDVWETYRQRASDQRRNLEIRLASIDNMLEEITTELSQEDERRNRLRQIEESLSSTESLRKNQESILSQIRKLDASLQEQRHFVESQAGQYQTELKRLDTLRSQISEHTSERMRFESQLEASEEVEKNYHDWLKKRQELEKWEEIAANFRQHDGERAAPLTAIEAQRARLQQELHALEQEQQQVNDNQSQLTELNQQWLAGKSDVDKLAQKLDRHQEVEETLRTLVQKQSEADGENKHLKEQMEVLKERIEKLSRAEGVECPLCGQPLKPKDRKSLLKQLQSEGSSKGDQFRLNKAFIEQSQEQKSSLESELATFPGIENDLRTKSRITDQITDHIEQIQKAVESWQKNGALRLKEVHQKLKDEDFAYDERSRLAEINEVLKSIGYDAASHDALRRSEQEGRTSEEQFRMLENARTALGPLKKIISDLEKQLHSGEKELEGREKTYREAEERLRDQESKMPSLEKAEAELFSLQEQENRLRMQLGGALQQVEVLDTLRKRQHDLDEQRKEITRKISRIKMIERACSRDGVPALLIEQMLPDIEIQANEILDRLTAGGMTVRFATQKEYKDKKRDDVKETMDILIGDAAGTREYEMFSGGEAFRINFSIRMALSRVLAQRAGARLQTLVIDEGFGSQDAEGRQRLIEAINLVRPDFAKILVITHLEDLKDAFPARIEVEKSPRGSHLQVLV